MPPKPPVPPGPPAAPAPADRLGRYRAKRALERTPEPAGALRPAAGDPFAGGGHRFVVHQHAARRLHYDLRLELDGVLRSWAVPKGPSYDPADKRLAVHVEDHPLEYGDFEGIIPPGNYGAGAVILWDRGHWVPQGDPEAELRAGKLLFELRGLKLRGLWTLVKLRKSEKDWLLIKERDRYARAPAGELPPESVLSGLTVQELAEGKDRGAEIRRRLAELRAPARPVQGEAVGLMLADPVDRPFSRAGWVFELKLDGYRILAAKAGSEVRLLTRNGNDCAAAFPEVVLAVAGLPFDRLVLDGEVVILDEAGRPSFQQLQGRSRLRRPIDLRQAAQEAPATFFAFDLLGFEEFDVRPLPLVERKALLRRVLPPAGLVRYLDHFEREGEAVFEQVRKLDLEGMIAKKADSPYRAGRSSAWLKVRTRRSEDFVVVGFTAPRGSRSGFGALHLAHYVDGALTYAGRAGSGFTGKELAEVRARLDRLRREGPPCGGPVPRDRGTTWVEPELVCEVEYTEWTDEGLLRQPVFLRFRDDKRPEECVGRGAGGRAETPGGGDAPVGPPPRPPARPSPAFTNLDKVFWPAEGYTKRDLIEYYRAVAPWLLPYLADRPIVLTRYPDGIEGKSFFQKDAPVFVPDWIRTERMWSDQAEREIDYLVCDDLESLLYVVNLGTIPLHVWASRVASLERPDWCVLDLDPKEAPFAHVIEVARACHRLCERIGLPSFVKTSGSSGLHVLIPLGRRYTYAQGRSLAELLARVIAAELPDIATVTRQVSRRDGRVYLDYVQNGAGRLLVAPFSVRPLPGAPVSFPLEWREVTARLDIRRFTIRTAVERLERRGDPLRPVLALAPDLDRALSALVADG